MVLREAHEGGDAPALWALRDADLSEVYGLHPGRDALPGVCEKKIALRPAGVLHSAVGVVEGASPMGRRVWYLALWYFLLSFLRNPFGW